MDIPQLVRSLNAVDSTTLTDAPVEKSELLQAARALVNRLQAPGDRSYDLVWIKPLFTAALKIGTDISLWTHLSSNPQPYEILAVKTNTDPALLRRILRLLTAELVIEEGDEAETYRHGSFSSALQDPRGLVNGIQYYYHTPIKQHANLPTYFAQQGYKNPTNIASAPWKSLVGWPNYQGSRWQYLEEELPKEGHHFNALLAAQRRSQARWPDLYPIGELTEGYELEGAFLVDVGGGIGGDVTLVAQHLAETHPEARLVLQDQSAVINSIPEGTLPAKVECHAHDFFQPNPVHSARTYFLHSILHDWPDKEALLILQNITCSMKPGYSKLLLMERIMPARARDTPSATAALDLQMMCVFAALERTEIQWKELLAQAGLSITRIVETVAGGYSMIQAEL